jgi:F-type H+-transporting ATPase subunit b
MELVRLEWGLIFWTIVTFLVLLFILKKLAWKPILAMLEEREKKIQDSLDNAEQARNEAKTLLEKNNRMLKEARETSAQIIEKSKEQSEKMSRDIQARAQEESVRLIERAREEITREKKTAMNELRQETVDLGLAMAEKLIQGTIDRDVHKKLIESCIQNLSDSPD